MSDKDYDRSIFINLKNSRVFVLSRPKPIFHIKYLGWTLKNTAIVRVWH